MAVVVQKQKASVDAASRVQDAVIAVGTSTYDRTDYASSVVDPDRDPEQSAIYHCYHMCRDTQEQLEMAGIPSWSVMTERQCSDGFSQIHPVVIVADSANRFQLYDPAFGIFVPMQLPEPGEACLSSCQKYELSSAASGCFSLTNSANGKAFDFEFSPTQESFKTDDNYLVRRNNFPGDAYSMSYRYRPDGGLQACVTIHHCDKETEGCGVVVINATGPDGQPMRVKASTTAFAGDQVDGPLLDQLDTACKQLEKPLDVMLARIQMLSRGIPELQVKQQQLYRERCEGCSEDVVESEEG